MKTSSQPNREHPAESAGRAFTNPPQSSMVKSLGFSLFSRGFQTVHKTLVL
jgi:hypothetical protein